jgi:hypothetical protein
MILVDGLNFRREGDRWRCVEHPAIEMLPGEVFVFGDRRFRDVRQALEAASDNAPASQP